MLASVTTRRIDIFIEDGSYILQTTKHPKLNVTEFLNAFPKAKGSSTQDGESGRSETSDHLHLRIQWGLVQLGRAEGCSIWVPVQDRNLAYQKESLREHTLERLPNLGFEENARRIVQNIDVLWVDRNVIRKAFEIEATTTIYSGLLRLNDLALSQPNNRVDLYIAASRSKRVKVQNQLFRPSFQSLVPRCEFIAFEDIDEQMRRLAAVQADGKTRVTGLIRGEQFEVPEHYLYPPCI
jgi:hypothetical protein